MKSNGKVPLKNYLLLSVILILSVELTIYFYMWHNAYEMQKLNTPIVSEYLGVIVYNELDNYLVENKDAVIYVSALNNIDIRDFEKKFKRFVKKYSLNNIILYMDITSELDVNSTYEDINKKYGAGVPYIVVFRNGSVDNIFNIKDNDYDLDRVKEFLVGEGIISD